ncbi:MAG: hypothetical protein EB084_18760 [Proteobacteria bacterium]|nr:hypothetical protein [Pseudomonadota bacterium]
MKGTTRKRFAGWTLVISTMAMLALGGMLMRTPAQAEESLGEHSLITSLGNQKYAKYLYPNLNQAFYLPKQYETRFDIHNAKFFQIEYYDVIGNYPSLKFNVDVNQPEYLQMHCDVSFYNPRGELIHRFANISPNRWLSLPHNLTSLEYDRLQVRIRNHGQSNLDFRFVTLDPVDPVKGTPIPPTRDIHL